MVCHDASSLNLGDSVDSVVMSTTVKMVDSSTEQDFKFFRTQLDSIPPSAFFNEDMRKRLQGEVDSEDEEEAVGLISSKKGKKQKKITQDAKRIKLDPLKSKTVSQIQEDLDKQKSVSEEPYTKVKEKQKNKNKQNKKGKAQKQKRNLNEGKRENEAIERLKIRIAELQAKRGQLKSGETSEKKKLRRQYSKAMQKMKRKVGSMKVHGNLDKGQSSQTSLPKVSTPKTVSKPIYSKEGKLVFSKFDFSDSGEKDKSQNSLTGKDYKRLLEKVEKRQERIDKLKEKDAERGRSEEQKSTWKTAIFKAQGEKVKDDPALLKKAMKRKEKIKKQHKQKWEDRVATVQKHKDARQEKRTKNIQQRKKEKIDKKIKKAKKKGRIIPGF